MTPELQDKLAHLPTGPGVYQHRDAEGTVLYVGKAKNLRHRVRSYFQESRPREARLQALIAKIADVEVIVTDTEAEALILENNLIKRLRPRYNVNLKDDKTYPFICIKKERFPRVFPTRRPVRDGSKYFGPYTDVKNMKLVLATIRSIFKLRSCNLHLSDANIRAGKFQPCLDYHIQKCAAPCAALESQEHYDQTILQIEKLLNGKTGELIALLKDEMLRLAGARQFEEAAELRDRVSALEKYSQKQKVIAQDTLDRDLFALAADFEAGLACGVMFQVREGKLVGRRHKFVRRLAGVTESDLMQRLVEDHYADATFYPDEIMLTAPLLEPEPVSQLLRQGRGRKVEIRVPERGEKVDLMRMVQANADLLLGELKLQQEKQEQEQVPRAVLALQRDLRLKRAPRRIECFDISHLAGTGTVASCVVFEDGKPKKSEYRTYKIRTTEQGRPDDFQSMREVVERRYLRLLQENGPWPDLVVIDGARKLSLAAVEALRKTDVYGRFTVVGLAKRLEEVFFPGDTQPLMIPRTSSALRLLQRVRDEAHRFAVKAQQKQRQLTTLHSELMDIPGVGDRSVRKLLRQFGSVQRVRTASDEALAEVVGPAVARRVRVYFEEGASRSPAGGAPPTAEGA